MKAFITENPVLSTFIVVGVIIIFYVIFFRKPKNGSRLAGNGSLDPTDAGISDQAAAGTLTSYSRAPISGSQLGMEFSRPGRPTGVPVAPSTGGAVAGARVGGAGRIVGGGNH